MEKFISFLYRWRKMIRFFSGVLLICIGILIVIFFGNAHGGDGAAFAFWVISILGLVLTFSAL